MLVKVLAVVATLALVVAAVGVWRLVAAQHDADKHATFAACEARKHVETLPYDAWLKAELACANEAGGK